MTFSRGAERRVLKDARLSLTPMIDVVFLLLIFFIVGMKFRELDGKLEAKLPEAGEQAEEPTSRPVPEIWIRIDDAAAGGSGPPKPKVVIDQVVMRDWNHVYGRLKHLSRFAGARHDPVILDPTDRAQHGWVMKVMGFLRQLGYQNVSFRRRAEI